MSDLASKVAMHILMSLTSRCYLAMPMKPTTRKQRLLEAWRMMCCTALSQHRPQPPCPQRPSVEVLLYAVICRHLRACVMHGVVGSQLPMEPCRLAPCHVCSTIHKAKQCCWLVTQLPAPQVSARALSSHRRRLATGPGELMLLIAFSGTHKPRFVRPPTPKRSRTTVWAKLFAAAGCCNMHEADEALLFANQWYADLVSFD